MTDEELTDEETEKIGEELPDIEGREELNIPIEKIDLGKDVASLKDMHGKSEKPTLEKLEKEVIEIIQEKDKESYDEVQETERLQKVKNFTAKLSFSNQRQINPTLDFFENRVFLTIPIDENVPIPVRGTNEIINDRIKQPYVITSDRIMYKLKYKYCEELNLFFSHVPSAFENRWSNQSVKDFFDRKEQNISFAEVFYEIRELMKKYIDFDDNRYYSLVTLWIIGTYFHRIFNSYPYLYFGGTKQVGKSKMLDFIDCLAFNSLNSLSNTSATMYRMIQEYSPTLLIDEEFKVAKKEMGDYHAILCAGYKKGRKVYRSRERISDKKYIQEKFETYCPKAFANIEGIENVLENRTISVIMLRTENRVIANSEIIADDAIWQKIRDKLYLLLFKLGSVCSNITYKSEIYDSPNSSTRNDGDNDLIINNKTLQTLQTAPLNYKNTCITLQTLQTAPLLLKTFKRLEISARLRELFSGILTLATILELEQSLNNATKNQNNATYFENNATSLLQENIYNEIYSLVKDIEKEKLSEEIETEDVNLLSWFVENIDANKFYSTIEVTNKIKSDENIDEGFRNNFNTRSLGWFLRRYKLYTSKRRIKGKAEVLLNPEKIRVIAKKFSVEKQIRQDNIDEKPEPIVDKPESKQEEKINDDKNALSFYNNQRTDNQNIDDTKK